MLKHIQAVVLAAGTSSRFNTGKTKLLEKVCGQELVIYPLSLLAQLNIPTIAVLGYQHDLMEQCIEKYYPSRCAYVLQDEQHGTAHALAASQSLWNAEHILIMRADMPLINAPIIKELYEQHIQTNATVSFVSSHCDNPSGFSYSRVEKKDGIIRVVDPYELSSAELLEHCCINTGIMIVQREFLQNTISQIQINRNTRELHVSSLINIATDMGKIVTMTTAPFDTARDINTYQDLWAVEQIKRGELIRYWMTHGVRFSTAQSVNIDLDVTIGAGTFIGCGANILSGTRIGMNCTISQFAVLSHAQIGDSCIVHPYTMIRNATVHEYAQVGPYAHIQETTIGDHAQIGNFVEVKRSTIGTHTKAKHLTYLGDAQIGSHVNIGAGTITCNYDGKQKHKTTIKDNAFIGSNNSIVAPVTIHEKALTAAGSTITMDVPTHALAIARARQVNKLGYTAEKKEIHSEEETAEKNNVSFSFYGALKTNTEPTHNT